MLTPFVREAGMTTAGRMEPRLSITGPIDSPRIDGDIVVSNGEIRLVDPRVIVSDLSARTVLSRMSGRITELTGSINGGTLTGDGTIEYNDDGQVDLQLTSDIRGMALEFPEGLRGEIDAALGLTMTAPEPMAGRISGTVTVVRGSYREPLAVVTGLLAASRAQRLAAAAEPSPLLDALALDVRVITDEDIFVDNNYGRFQIGGDLRLIGTASAPGLSGRAELREDGRLFVGRNVYTIESGAINFSNPVTIEPDLNLDLATSAGGHEIEVTLTGTPENLTPDYRSLTDPGLGDADVVALLLTGRPLESLDDADAAFVSTQVLGNFSAEVLGFASRAVGLDTLRLGGVENQALRRDPTTVATELDPTTRVTFGKSLGSNVDITFSQSLREGDAQTWIVDYLPARGLELRLVSDDEDLRSYGFFHDLSLGGAARVGQPSADRERADLRVVRVDVAGDLALPEARVRDALRLNVGDRFDFASWQDDRDRLEALYRGERYLTVRINARRTDEADGVALVYDIAAGPLTSIEITGIEATSALRERLETAWAEAVFDEFLIDESTDVIRAEVGRSGYLQPSVQVAIRDTPGMKTLVVTVDPGARTTRTVIRIDGTGEALGEEIQSVLAASGVIDDAVSDPGGVEDAATAFLRNRGYLRASARAGAPLFDEGVATVPLNVDAGGVFVVSEVSFRGAAGLDTEMLRGVAAVDPREPYVPALIEEARQRLVAVYRREAFASAVVLARPIVDDVRPEVALAFEVTEGPRQVLSEIVVTGNRGVTTDVIRRALAISEGQPLSADEVVQARTRVFDTGLFRRIDLASEPADAAAQSGITPMRLRVTVEEWPAARLRYGLVVAEERPEDKLEGRELVPGISANLTRRTLFGRPMGVGTAISLQRRDQSGRVFVNTPTFFGLPVESSLIGEGARETFAAVSFVTNRRSLTWEQRTRVARNLTLSYAYTFERNHTFDTGPPDPFAPTFDITVNIARINAAVAWDSRDDPTDTTRGLFASSTSEYAPEAVGSDIRFIRQLQQGYYFRPWRGMVFASAARAGVVVPLAGQDLIVSERFFAGGSRTVRGVAEESLGGRDFFGDPTGGQLMVVLNQEVRVPIYRWVRGVGFVDAGNVFAKPGDASLRDLAGSVGVGLRLATPFALLRVDFAKTAWGAPATSGRWTFGIGQAF
jgi:outer membrane protein assembly complex protein YaeT